MIVDFVQKQDMLDISFVNSAGQIEIENLILEDGYYGYFECDEFDKNRITELRSFKGSYVKREPTKYFSHHNVNEFLTYDLRTRYKSAYERLNKLNIPNPYSVDIETDITDEYGYSSADRAENAVLSISFTDINLESMIFVLKNPAQPEFNLQDEEEIRSVLYEALGDYKSKYNYGFKIRVFDNEADMLNTFLECVNKYFHSIFGWYFLLYDWQYIYNRCLRLGINPKKASPKGRMSKKRVEINDHTHLDFEIPTHRIINDYIIFAKESLVYNQLGDYSLNNFAEITLGLKKVSYSGNLRKLYRTNFNKFIGYALIDTILVMLIHKKTNLYNVDFFQSYYTNVPYLKISQNSISEALVYQELRDSNMFLLESEKSTAQKRKYQGGYVKPPTKKIVESVTGEDFKALYPNSINSIGISPEKKIDSINVNPDGWPLTEKDARIWEGYKAQGFTLSPMGRIYDSREDGLYVRIEKKLLNQRQIFKGHAEDIYLNVVPKLEAEIKKRKASGSVNT